MWLNLVMHLRDPAKRSTNQRHEVLKYFRGMSNDKRFKKTMHI